jgi:hypothetical protein
MTLPAGIIAKSYPDDRTVYHRGVLWDSAAPLPAFAYQVGNISVPPHAWNAQWTDRPPIIVNKTPAQIVAANRMFPFGDTGCIVSGVGTYVFAGPMDSAGIQKYMPQTGERPDIGLVTDPSALFMLTAASGPMLAWAQAAGSCPMHFRDENTGKPVDLTKYPQANAYDLPDKQGRPFFLKGPYSTKKGEEAYTGFENDWGVQQAHFPEMSYVAYMATGDLGFLSDLQYEANFMVLTNASASTPNGAIVAGETRGIGWSLRQLFMAHIATLDAEARGINLDDYDLLPSSDFKKLLDQSLVYYTAISNDPKNQTFRLLNEFDRFSPWTVDYLLTALAFGVLSGHTDWAPLYLWCLGNVIARTDGLSGWPVVAGTSYRQNTVASGQPLTWAQSFANLVGDSEVMLTAVQRDAAIANPTPTGKPLMNDENDYMQVTRGVLVMADYLDKKGLAKVRVTYPAFNTCLANGELMFRALGIVSARMSYVSDPNAAPITLPPVVEPPPVIVAPPPVVEPPKPLARVAGSAINGAIFARVGKGETIVVTYNKQDSALLVPLKPNG